MASLAKLVDIIFGRDEDKHTSGNYADWIKPLTNNLSMKFGGSDRSYSHKDKQNQYYLFNQNNGDTNTWVKNPHYPSNTPAFPENDVKDENVLESYLNSPNGSSSLPEEEEDDDDLPIIPNGFTGEGEDEEAAAGNMDYNRDDVVSSDEELESQGKKPKKPIYNRSHFKRCKKECLSIVNENMKQELNQDQLDEIYSIIKKYMLKRYNSISVPLLRLLIVPGMLLNIHEHNIGMYYPTKLVKLNLPVKLTEQDLSEDGTSLTGILLDHCKNNTNVAKSLQSVDDVQIMSLAVDRVRSNLDTVFEIRFNGVENLPPVVCCAIPPLEEVEYKNTTTTTTTTTSPSPSSSSLSSTVGSSDKTPTRSDSTLISFQTTTIPFSATDNNMNPTTTTQIDEVFMYDYDMRTTGTQLRDYLFDRGSEFRDMTHLWHLYLTGLKSDDWEKENVKDITVGGVDCVLINKNLISIVLLESILIWIRDEEYVLNQRQKTQVTPLSSSITRDNLFRSVQQSIFCCSEYHYKMSKEDWKLVKSILEEKSNTIRLWDFKVTVSKFDGTPIAKNRPSQSNGNLHILHIPHPHSTSNINNNNHHNDITTKVVCELYVVLTLRMMINSD